MFIYLNTFYSYLIYQLINFDFSNLEWEADLEEVAGRDSRMRSLLQIDFKTFSERVYASDLAKFCGIEYDEEF